MRVYKNEITVYRGETFTITKRIENRDGSPYIVSSEMVNPHWLLTVSNSRYNQQNRYVLNKWLSLKNHPRFKITKPISVNKIPTEDDYESYESFDEMPLPAGYEGDETTEYANVAVFYQEDARGNRVYKYWKYNNQDAGNYEGYWEDYSCIISTTFTSDITSKWIEQTYYYGILLVSGEMNDDSDKPISLDLTFPILGPTKLTVQSNLKGAMM